MFKSILQTNIPKKQLLNARKFSVLIALLFVFVVIPFALSGCGGSGCSSSSSSPTPSTSTITGTVNGGLKPVSGSTVTLCESGSTPSSGCPLGGTSLGSATSSSSGSFSITYTPPSANTLLYIEASGGNAGGGTNTYIDLVAAIGPSNGLPSTSVTVNELTTVTGVELFDNANTLTVINVFNDAYSALINVSTGAPLTYAPSTQGTEQKGFMTDYEVAANALASCVQTPSTCSAVAGYVKGSNALPTTTLDMAEDVFEFQYNGAYDSTMFTNLYTYNTMAPSTGWNMPAGAPSFIASFGYNYVAGSYPDGIAIDGSGNAWVANYGSGTAGTASGDSNVTELSSKGALLGTYTAGSDPARIAIDASGNVWVANNGNGTAGTASGDSNVTELSPAGGVVGTYVAGSAPIGIAIDGSGNAWVANWGNGTAAEFVGVATPVTTPLLKQPK